MLVKHLVIAVMAVVGLVLQYGIAPALERTTLLLANDKGAANTLTDFKTLRQREIWLTWVLGLMGLSVLGMSAWLGAL